MSLPGDFGPPWIRRTKATRKDWGKERLYVWASRYFSIPTQTLSCSSFSLVVPEASGRRSGHRNPGEQSLSTDCVALRFS